MDFRSLPRRFFHTVYAHPFISLFHIVPLLVLLPSSLFFFWQEVVVPLYPLLSRFYHPIALGHSPLSPNFFRFLLLFLSILLSILLFFPFLVSYAFVDQWDYRERAWNNGPSRALALLHSPFFLLFHVLVITHVVRFYHHLHGQNIWEVVYHNAETLAGSVIIPGFLWLCVRSLPVAETDLVSEYNYDDSNFELEAMDLVFWDEQDRILDTIKMRLDTRADPAQRGGEWTGQETITPYLFKDLWTHCPQDWVGNQRISLFSPSPLKGDRYFHPPLRPWFAGGARDGEFDPFYEAVMIATGLHPHLRRHFRIIKIRIANRPPIPQGLTIEDDFRLYVNPGTYRPDERSDYLIRHRLTRIYDPAMAKIFPLGAG